MQIEYYVKSVYGIECMYIKDQETAHNFRQLTERKTISHSDMNAVAKLFAVEFIQVLPPKAE